MKAADGIVYAVTGNHLSLLERSTAAPLCTMPSAR